MFIKSQYPVGMIEQWITELIVDFERTNDNVNFTSDKSGTALKRYKISREDLRSTYNLGHDVIDRI